MRVRPGVSVLLAAGVLLVAGCGSSSGSSATTASTTTTSSTTSTTTPATTTTPTTVASSSLSVTEARKVYVRDANAVSAALNTFATKAKAWTNSTTDAQAESDAVPAITAIQRFDHELLIAHWPANVQTDVKTVVSDTGPVVGDLESLATITQASASSWIATFERDASTVQAAAEVVRSDLGLPPTAS